jgi:hypothetical protein
VKEDYANIALRYPTVGVIEPTILPTYTPIQLPTGQPLLTESVLRLAWGSDAHNVGLDAGPEQATVGPDSFDVAPNGAITLLDHVNARVTIFDPQHQTFRHFPVPIQGAGDVAIDAQGRVTVLDLVGKQNTGAKLRIPQLYQLDPNGTIIAETPVFARRPSGLTTDLAVLDRSDGRILRPLDVARQGQDRTAQQRSRSQPTLLIQWLDDQRARLADPENGVAVEITADAPFGAVAYFGRAGQEYVAVFEWMQHLRIVWFDASGQVVQDGLVPNQQSSVFNPTGRVAVDGTGAVYVLGSTPDAVEVFRVQGPAEVQS